MSFISGMNDKSDTKRASNVVHQRDERQKYMKRPNTVVHKKINAAYFEVSLFNLLKI